MKTPSKGELLRYASDGEDLAVKGALRAMRDESPSEDSRRATLAALGIEASPPPSATARRLVLAQSVALGLLFGCLIALLIRLLGR